MYMYRIPAPHTTCAQVEHKCRKDWDTYVQRLETVDVDRQTGSEVVHWVMRFPVSGGCFVLGPLHHVHVHVHVHCTYTCTCVHVCMYMCTCMYVHCMYMYMYIVVAVPRQEQHSPCKLQCPERTA